MPSYLWPYPKQRKHTIQGQKKTAIDFIDYSWNIKNIKECAKGRCDKGDFEKLVDELQTREYMRIEDILGVCPSFYTK